LIAFSVGVTSYLVSMPLFSDGETVMLLRTRLLSLMPVIISTCAFTLLYALVPNRPVPLRHAIAGGLVAALLFELAKRGFALYVTAFPTYQTIYGALAAVPIFLIWIYLSWSVTLLGAEFAYCLGIYREDWQEKRSLRGGALILAYQLLKLLHQAQSKGESLSGDTIMQKMATMTHGEIDESLLTLQAAKLVLRDENGSWALARDLDDVSFSDLYYAGDYALPASQSLDGESDEFRDLMQRLEHQFEETMDQPLAGLMRD
jgi:membrane protein